MTLKTKIIASAAIVFFSVLLNLTIFKQLLQVSLRNDYSSHILLIPFVSALLLYYRRSSIFSYARLSILSGGIIVAVGVALLIWPNWESIGLSASAALSVKAFAIILFWIGAFLFLYGGESFRKAIFPLLFLLFMIPLPEVFLDAIIPVLQRGSAEMTALLFKITGTPHYRNDLIFVLPGITIEIARECSSIRSSMALLITTLLAAHLMLRTVWRKSILVALAVPLAMFKNAIRITTLSLLSVHIDTRFLKNSDLHRDGGILFYILAFVLMMAILALLRRSEKKADDGLQIP
jgi:exosortase